MIVFWESGRKQQKGKEKKKSNMESITSNMIALNAEMFKVRQRKIKPLMGSGCFPGTLEAVIQMF